MLRKSITYTNPFTNTEITEDHFFHISKADLVEMELEEHNQTYTKGDQELTGMQAKLQRIVDSEDGRAIMAEFKDIIRRAYGKKDGDRFLKSKEIADDFLSSEAFSQLLFELSTDADAATEFMQGIIPPNLEQIAAEIQERAQRIGDGRAAQEIAKAAGTPAETTTPEDPTGLTNPTTPQVLTQAQIADMDPDELKSGLATGRYKLS